MKRAIAAAAVAMLALCAPAWAADDIKFPEYLSGKKPLAGPYLSTDKLPITRNNQTYQIEGSSLVTTDGAQSLSGKSIDCSLNTCTNFPGVPYTAIPECPDSAGQHLNFTNGVFSCGTTGGTGGGTSVIVLTADDGATALTADNGTTSLTAN